MRSEVIKSRPASKKRSDKAHEALLMNLYFSTSTIRLSKNLAYLLFYLPLKYSAASTRHISALTYA